jgi:transcriptional regulator with XRE-family HTH domain
MALLELHMPLKDRLRELRIAAGLTQQALAVEAGLSVSNVVHIEWGKIPDPRASTIVALARALGCTPNDLLADTEPREAKPRGPRGGKAPKKK